MPKTGTPEAPKTHPDQQSEQQIENPTTYQELMNWIKAKYGDSQNPTMREVLDFVYGVWADGASRFFVDSDSENGRKEKTAAIITKIVREVRLKFDDIPTGYFKLLDWIREKYRDLGHKNVSKIVIRAGELWDKKKGPGSSFCQKSEEEVKRDFLDIMDQISLEYDAKMALFREKLQAIVDSGITPTHDVLKSLFEDIGI